MRELESLFVQNDKTLNNEGLSELNNHLVEQMNKLPQEELEKMDSVELLEIVSPSSESTPDGH